MSARERQKIDKAVRNLERKKLLSMLHHEFREIDSAKQAHMQQASADGPPTGLIPVDGNQSGLSTTVGSSIYHNKSLHASTSRGIIDQSILSHNSGNSSLGPDQDLASPPTDLYSVKSIVDEITWQKQSQKMKSMIRSHSSFGSVLSKAREEISRLPFSPLQHRSRFIAASADSVVVRPALSAGDKSKHFVGEFGDNWFENDKPGLKRLLSMKTRKRTRFERDEFLKACKIATTQSAPPKTARPESAGPDLQEGPNKNVVTAKDGGVSSQKLSSQYFSDPNTDGRLVVYDMLRSSNGTILKRRIWKNLRSNSKCGPFLDACPGLTPISGRPTLNWSSATGHDKPLPKSQVICNAEAKGAIVNMKNSLRNLERKAKAFPSTGLTIKLQLEAQELHRSINFYKTELKRVYRTVPSIQRKDRAALEARRFAAIQARKARAQEKKLEAKRLQEEKAAKAARAAALFAAANRPPSSQHDEETEEEKQRRVEDEAARTLQRIGQGYLGRKRFKEHETSRPKSKKGKKKKKKMTKN